MCLELGERHAQLSDRGVTRRRGRVAADPRGLQFHIENPLFGHSDQSHWPRYARDCSANDDAALIHHKLRMHSPLLQ